MNAFIHSRSYPTRMFLSHTLCLLYSLLSIIYTFRWTAATMLVENCNKQRDGGNMSGKINKPLVLHPSRNKLLYTYQSAIIWVFPRGLALFDATVHFSCICFVLAAPWIQCPIKAVTINQYTRSHQFSCRCRIPDAQGAPPARSGWLSGGGAPRTYACRCGW